MGKSKRRTHNNRRRQKKQVEEEPSVTIQDEIEAQLERQRRKRALSETRATPPPPPPATIGGFEFDPSKDAYFPKGEVKKQQPHQVALQRTAATFSSHIVATFGRRSILEQIPTRSLGHVTETCTIPLRAVELRAQWAGRVMLSAMQVESSARRQYDAAVPVGWTSLLPQLKRERLDPTRPFGCETSWDLSCKSSLHASSRTFDVQQGRDESRLPEIATLVDGGVFVRSSNPRVWTEQQYMGTEWNRSSYFDADRGASMVRFAPHKCLARLSSQRSGIMEMLQITPGQYVSTRVGVSCCDCNDVAFHPQFGNGCCTWMKNTAALFFAG